jgi:hypothetical protein
MLSTVSLFAGLSGFIAVALSAQMAGEWPVSSVSAKSQSAPAAASSGTNIAVVWKESDGGVYVGRLTLDGKLLDFPGIKVGVSDLYVEPRIVFDGENYIVGWVGKTAPYMVVKVARLAPASGVVLDTGGVTLGSTRCGVGEMLANSLALASSDTGTLVAWGDCVPPSHVVLTALARDLSHPPPATMLSLWGPPPIAAAWNGHEWVVTWVEARFDLPEGNLWTMDIKGVRLSPTLDRLGPALLYPYDSPYEWTNSGGPDGGPFIASDGSEFLLMWTERVPFYYGFFPPVGPKRVMALRVPADGLLNAGAKPTRLATGQAMGVVWDGSQYNVALSSDSVPHALYVTQVAAHGPIESMAPLAAGPFPFTGDSSLLVIGPGRVKVVYTRPAQSEYGGVVRAFIASPHPIRRRASGNP